MRIQTNPNPQLPRTTPPPSDTPSTADERMLAWAEHNKDQVALGTNLVVAMGNGHQYVVAGTHVGPAQKSLNGIRQFLTAGVQEVQAAIQAGPSLALTAATEVVKPLVLSSAPAEVLPNIDQWYTPGVLGASVGLSVIKFVKTYKESQTRKDMGQSNSLMQTVGLITNGAHLATTTLGLVGVLGAALVPSMRGFASTAQGVALAGNVVAFGINWMEYFNNRSQSYSPLGDVKKPQ